MENLFFQKTKTTLYNSSKEVKAAFRVLSKKPPSFWELSIPKHDQNAKSHLAKIYNVNQSLLHTLGLIKDGIYEGKMNNSREYTESDFITTEAIINLHNLYSNESNACCFSDIAVLKEKTTHQMKELHDYIDHFPEDLATNVKLCPRVISDIPLDYYQIIYLTFAHAKTQIQQIQLIEQLTGLSSAFKVN